MVIFINSPSWDLNRLRLQKNNMSWLWDLFKKKDRHKILLMHLQLDYMAYSDGRRQRHTHNVWVSGNDKADCIAQATEYVKKDMQGDNFDIMILNQFHNVIIL